MHYYPGTGLPKFLSATSASAVERIERSGGVESFSYHFSTVSIAQAFFSDYLESLRSRGFIVADYIENDMPHTIVKMVTVHQKRILRSKNVGSVVLSNVANTEHAYTKLCKGGLGIVYVRPQ